MSQSETYTGFYHVNDEEPRSATMQLLKDRIAISFRNDNNDPRLVYWYYEKINEGPFWKFGKSVVHYTNFPAQTIECTSKEFSEKLESLVNRRRSITGKASNSFAVLFLKLFTILAVILAIVYFWLVPFLAVRLANRVPVSYEQKLGDGLFDAMKTGFVVDQEKTFLLNEFYRELKIQSVYDIRITVVKDNVVNAFAVPGGNIVVYDKIIARMNGYEELAALIAHEFTHVENKHTTKSLFRKMGSSVLLSVILGDVGAIGSVILSNADKLKHLSYSRSLEREADENGLKILSERKINGNGFVGLFNILKKEDTGETSEWINSHPNLDKRINYIQKSSEFNKNGVEKNEVLYELFLKIKTI